MTAPAVEAPPPALDTGALSESTRGTASGASLSGLPASGDVETVVEVVEDVDDVEVVVVVDVVEGGVLGLVVVEGCTVTFIVANTFRPLCLAPPQTYSSTSHLQHDTLYCTVLYCTVLSSTGRAEISMNVLKGKCAFGSFYLGFFGIFQSDDLMIFQAEMFLIGHKKSDSC